MAPEVTLATLLASSDADALIGIHENGAVRAVRAHALGSLSPEDVGSQVAVMFVGGDPDRPLILGVVRGSRSSGRLPGSVSEITSALPAPEFDIERLLLSAKGQIVLRCGKARITLTRAGKIILRGSYLSSRSSGANRIKGGSVQVN